MQGEGGSVYVSVDLPNVERLVMSENALPACTNMTLGSGAYTSGVRHRPGSSLFLHDEQQHADEVDGFDSEAWVFGWIV